MFKFFRRCFFSLFYCIVGCIPFMVVQLPTPAYAHSAIPLAAQVSFTGTTLGHPGTMVQITGAGFTPASTVSLYTTTTPDPARCAAATDPVAAGLTPFSSSPTVTTQANGTFNVATTWPNNVATATTAYSICALSTDFKVLSTNAFTVAQAVTIDSVSPNSAAQGAVVTIAGSNWLPVQPLDVSIITDGAPALTENNNVTPDANGHFSVMLTVPPNAQPRSYAVRVFAVNEQTMTLLQNNMLTVTQAMTPTPTPTVAPSPTAAPASTPTAVPTAIPTTAPTGNTNTGGGNTAFTYLPFVLGGLGVMLVVIGITMFFAYSRP